MKKSYKALALCLTGVMAVSALAGCGSKKAADGKINISIGGWPDEAQEERVKAYDGYKQQMAEKFPDVNLIPETGNYSDEQFFTMKAAANQIPTTYTTNFTQIQNTINNGYAGDITEVLEERGLLDALNPALIDTVKGSDGKIYAFPEYSYMMGMAINKSLFREAGLVNEDGTAKIPNTYEELAEYARIIKEKTGKSGFAICTTSNCGGWHFMNIAWSYGVEFMKQRDDGTWEATFNTPEAVEALQYVKDLKWKYDVLPDDTVIDQTASLKLLGVGQTAMIFSTPVSEFVSKYGMDVKDYAVAKTPAGPKGRYSQMGGGVYMFSPTATKEELNACFDFLKVMGVAEDKLEGEALANKETKYQTDLAEAGIVLPLSPLELWAAPERKAKEEELNKKYCNMDPKDYENYLDLSDVELKSEEPMCCQQLYGILDKCIQEVITNKDADCKQVIENACNDFQVNHLDKMD